jgi:hypothetical protein
VNSLFRSVDAETGAALEEPTMGREISAASAILAVVRWPVSTGDLRATAAGWGVRASLG